MNEMPKDEILDSYSADEKWVKHELYGDSSQLVYLIAWPVSLVMFLLVPIVGIICYAVVFCIVVIYGGKSTPKHVKRLVMFKIMPTMWITAFFTLLDQITFGWIDWISKKAKSLALKNHEYETELYSYKKN